ncbi:hypothetical protein OIE90_00390 [Streptomyces cellulosae]|nr:hypothetical protein OG880_00390 [Streptomyces cellulosae]WSB89037.1 hypothetical protein OHA60_01000 [Streptomyces cellulosae]WTB73665.1 hypothetical protein OIE90_00390 [Streptomyces cellulosae]
MERPDDRRASALRFATELVAWVATPWALSRQSWVLAVVSVVVRIGRDRSRQRHYVSRSS